MFRKLSIGAIFAAAAVLAVIYGVGLSYYSHITPRASNGMLYRVHGDRWLEDGAKVRLDDLAPRGNRLKINFGDWHPEGLAAPRVEASVCGQPASIFEGVRGGSTTIFLRGNCNPREVSFKILNPFVASERDQRKLGLQVRSFEISSKLGVPLASGNLVIPFSLAIFAIALLAYSVTGVFSVGLLIPVLSLVFLHDASHLTFDKIIALGVCVGALLLGGLRWETVKQKARDPGVLVTVAALGVVAVAGYLRFAVLDFGLPSLFHPDEVPKYNAVMRMRQFGDLNPRYFLHPSVLLYTSYFINELIQWIGFPGEWEQTVTLAGRIGSALAGTLSVYLTYLIGRRLFTPWAGLIGAAILAVAPLHVTCSRYVKEDALLLFFILATIYLVVKAVYDGKPGWLLVAGVFAGISASTKYSGLLAGVILASAPWLRSGTLMPDWRYMKWAIRAMFIMPLAFLICTPYSLLDLPTFLRDFNHERNHMAKGHTLTIDAWSQLWMYHLSNSIIPGMTFAAAFAGLVGFGMLIRTRTREALFLIGLALLFYLPAEWVKAKPAPQPERYIVPCLPFLALGAGYFLTKLRQVATYRVVAPALLVLLLAFPAMRSIQLGSEAQYDTRAQMSDWMVGNLPHGARVAVDWKPYTVRFPNGEFGIDYLSRAHIIEELDISKLRASESDYLVLSSLFYDRYFRRATLLPVHRERIRQLFRELPIVKHVEPRYGTYGFHNPTVTLFSLDEGKIARLTEERRLKGLGELEHTSNEVRASLKWE